MCSSKSADALTKFAEELTRFAEELTRFAEELTRFAEELTKFVEELTRFVDAPVKALRRNVIDFNPKTPQWAPGGEAPLGKFPLYLACLWLPILLNFSSAS